MAKNDMFDLPENISTTDAYKPGPKSSSFSAVQEEIDKREWGGLKYDGDLEDMDRGPMRNRRNP